jgi:hypothetical protein
MARWHCDAVWEKYTSTPRVGVRSLLATFGLFALNSAMMLSMLGYAEVEEGPPPDSVADPGCLSRIPDPTIFHFGSRTRIRIKEFKYFNPPKKQKKMVSKL